MFPEWLLIGLALPNRAAESQMDVKGYNLSVLNGSNWTAENCEEAEYYRSMGIFEGLQAEQVLHIP
jgi:hypothetical protein